MIVLAARVAAGVSACRRLFSASHLGRQKRPSRRRGLLFACASALLVSALSPLAVAGPIEFTFTAPANETTPFARELWAEVTTPAGRTVRLPAFFVGDGRFAVRARPEGAGVYRLGAIEEMTEGNTTIPLVPTEIGAREIAHRGAPVRPAIARDPKNPRGFALATGEPFVPIGANLPWPSRGRMDYYRQGIPAYGGVGLNWMRIWMAHWSGLNLDWLPPAMGASPKPGTLDLKVAADWDELLALAEANGVYVQLVLQHHGQYSTTVNPNWDENPWNAALPHGFLVYASEFFTSEQARIFTKRKYRTIVARYGWSPAIMAWELFNEVHWVDALKNDNNVEAVARWHAEMADYIRSVDAYDHLVATSTDDLRSPHYPRMDFFQPHLYPSNILAAIRTYHVPFTSLDRPVFYGEFGDDHQPLTEAEKKAHHAIVPPVWASLMGTGDLPAQVWLGWNLLDSGRIAEHGAVAKFLAATKIAERRNLAPFSAAVESQHHRVPLLVTPSHVWQRRPVTEVAVPLDGRQPLEFADIPRMLVPSRNGDDPDSIPSRAVFRVNFPEPAKLIARFANGGDRGAKIRVAVDQATAAEHTWPARERVEGQPKRPADVAFEVAAGEHVIAIESVGGEAVEFHHLNLGRETAALAAIGKRSADFVALWLWHRTEIFAVDAPAPVNGTVVIEDVPAGKWRVMWWDTFQGTPGRPRTLSHRGGTLRVETPRISRHGAVTLERVSSR